MLGLLKRKTVEVRTRSPKETPLQRYHRQHRELGEQMPMSTEPERQACYAERQALDEAWYASPEFAELKEQWAEELRLRDGDNRIYKSQQPQVVAATTKFIEQKKTKKGSKK